MAYNLLLHVLVVSSMLAAVAPALEPSLCISYTCPAVGHVQAVSAALGYLLLCIDKVAMLMGGPLLHESQYQGSTSTLWQPNSFWARLPANSAAILPLYVPGTSTSSSAGPSYSATTSRWVRLQMCSQVSMMLLLDAMLHGNKRVQSK